jgi:hypothetical protein
MLSEVFLTVLLTTGATTAVSTPAPMEIAEGKENGQVELTVQSGARANVLHLQSEVAVAQMEIRVEMTAGLDRENRMQLDLAAGPEGSQWRGTLELRRETSTSEVRVTPGLARNTGGSWIGIGIALSHADHSQPSLQLKTGFDF